MNDLVELVADEVGLAEPQARRTVEVMLEFLGKRLPEELVGRVEAVVNEKRKPGSLDGGLCGLFGLTRTLGD
jgi:hypothetical protein